MISGPPCAHKRSHKKNFILLVSTKGACHIPDIVDGLFLAVDQGREESIMSTRPFIIVIAAVLLIAASLGALTIWQGTTSAGAGGKALIGGPFSLVDQTGKRVTEKDFEGRYMIAYFGYTFCPDFCPLGLSTITAALELLDENEAQEIMPVFFSVDPKRDTVDQLADYAPNFHPRLIALTGSDDEVAAAAKAYRIYYNIPPQNGDEDGDNYAVDHSTFIYLMGPDGSYRAHFSHNATPEEIAERLKTELKSS